MNATTQDTQASLVRGVAQFIAEQPVSLEQHDEDILRQLLEVRHRERVAQRGRAALRVGDEVSLHHDGENGNEWLMVHFNCERQGISDLELGPVHGGAETIFEYLNCGYPPDISMLLERYGATDTAELATTLEPVVTAIRLLHDGDPTFVLKMP